MKVRTLVTFNDLKEKQRREIGEEFVVSKERYDEILKVGKFVEEVKEEVKEEEIKKPNKKG